MTDLSIKKARSLGVVGVAERPITVGRSTRNQIVLPDNAVSREHCVIERVEGVVRIRDLGSHFGTLVNGTRVDTQRLNPGDVITIGPYEIAYGTPGDGEAAEETRQAELATLEAEHAALEAERAALAAERETLAERTRHLETQQVAAASLEDVELALRARESTLADERERLTTLAGHLAERERALGEESERLHGATVSPAPAGADHHDLDRREAELTALTATLEERTSGLDEREGILSEREQTLEAERASLDERKAALDETDRELRQLAALLEERRQAVAATEDAHREKLAALDREEQAVAQERADIGALRETLQATESRLREEESQRHETLAVIERELQVVRSEAQSQRSTAAELERELATVREGLESSFQTADAERTSLMAKLAEAERLPAAADNGEEPNRLRTMLAGIRDAAERVSETRRSVRALESMWLDTDDRLDETGHADRNALMRRDAIAEQLAEAHEDRDAALIELERLVEALPVNR